MIRPTLALALLLSGCGAIDTHRARDPRGELIGMSLPDLLSCMGKPDAAMLTTRDTAIAQWSEKTADTGFRASLLGASVQIGGAGECKAVATVLRDGTVADMAFPGRHNANLFSAPSAACLPLIAECLDHPSSTDLPPGYDAVAILLPGK